MLVRLYLAYAGLNLSDTLLKVGHIVLQLARVCIETDKENHSGNDESRDPLTAAVGFRRAGGRCPEHETSDGKG